MAELTHDEVMTLKRLASEYKRNAAVGGQPLNHLQHQAYDLQIQLGRILYQGPLSQAYAFGAVKGYHTSGMDGYNEIWRASRYMYKCRWQPFRYDTQYLRAGLAHGPTHARVLQQKTSTDQSYLEGYVFGDAFMMYGDDNAYMQSVCMAVKCSIGWLLLPLPDVTASYRACYIYNGTTTATLTTTYVHLANWIDEAGSQGMNNGEQNGFAFGYSWSGGGFDEVPINVGGLYEFEVNAEITPGAAGNGVVEIALSIQLDGETASATGSIAGPKTLMRVSSGDVPSTHFGRANQWIPANTITRPYKWTLWWRRNSGSASATIANLKMRVIRVGSGHRLNMLWPTEWQDNESFQEGPGLP